MSRLPSTDVTVRLTVDEAAWRDHVRATATAPHLLPVVKGNGYGFGRALLADTAAAFARAIAVGTLHELADVRPDRFEAVVVLTPATTIDGPIPQTAVPTVGRRAHVEVLAAAGWRGRVAVKLASAMHRYGAEPHEFDALVAAVHEHGMTPCRYVMHPRLAGPDAAPSTVIAAVEAWLGRLDPSVPLSISHLDRATVTALSHAHPRHGFESRLGTALWHGDKSFFHLSADVVDVRQVRAGTAAGYRGASVAGDGHLVMIGAGSAHGVAPLADGRSPFHFARRRLALHEAPHMHTSMVFVPDGDPCPVIGDHVDLQRPLITTVVDRVVWR